MALCSATLIAVQPLPWPISYNATVGGSEGGIWGGAGDLVADNGGNIYLTTGNGTFNANTGGVDLGDSFIRLNPNLTMADYFTPFNQSCLDAGDVDLGSGGPLLLQGSNYTELISGGKEGRIYVVNANSMGHYRTVTNPCGTGIESASNDTNIKQELPPGYVGGQFSTPSTWSNGTTQYVYIGGQKDHLKAFQVNSDGTLVTPAASQSPETFAWPGVNTFISSNGTSNGILWLTDPSGALRAYDATNLSDELFQSGLGGGYLKFNDPVVANGEVFVATQSTVDIFGLLPPSYEAESGTNTIAGGAKVVTCSTCSGGSKVGYIGKGGTLQFNTINASATGTYVMTINYIDGDAGRALQMSVNGGSAVTLNFHGTNNSNWTTLQNTLVNVQLNAGANTILFSNASAYGPDLDRVIISGEGNTTANSYQAESAANIIAGGAKLTSCAACSGGNRIGYIGKGGTLLFNEIYASSAGSYTLTINYVDGDAGRSAQMSVNGGSATTLSFHGTNDSNWNNVQSMTVTVQLNSGYNTIKFSNASAYGPDVDFIAV